MPVIFGHFGDILPSCCLLGVLLARSLLLAGAHPGSSRQRQAIIGQRQSHVSAPGHDWLDSFSGAEETGTRFSAPRNIMKFIRTHVPNTGTRIVTILAININIRTFNKSFVTFP